MNQIECKAYGKINLSLDVLGRREDGYHLVKMIMQTVDIFDTVVIKRGEKAAATAAEDRITIRVKNDDPKVKDSVIPTGPDNLVWRAARVMCDAYGIEDALTITLTKRIPIAAGMAGGSSDAAAVFRGIRDLYSLPVTDETLQALALPLGADIPYCITGGTQLSEGIGEVLTPLGKTPQCTLLIVKPDLYVSTGWVYKAFDSIPEADVIHPDVDAQIAAIKTGDLKGVAAACGNVLEQKTGAEYPVIGELERYLEARGAVRAIMTGSGPTVFALFDDAQAAKQAMNDLEREAAYANFQKFMTRFIYEI